MREYGNRYTEQELRETARKYENPEWIRLREALVPRAEKMAYRTAGAEPSDKKKHQAWVAKWNAAFHAQMDSLASAAWTRRS